MIRVPRFLRSMLRLCAFEAGRYRLHGVRVQSKDGWTRLEVTDGRRLGIARVPTPDAAPCEVTLRGVDVERLLGRGGPLPAFGEEDEFGDRHLDETDDRLDGALEIRREPDGKVLLGESLDDLSRENGSHWPDVSAAIPTAQPVARFKINPRYLREVLQAAEDATHPQAQAVWLQVVSMGALGGALGVVVQVAHPREPGVEFHAFLCGVQVEEGLEPPAYPQASPPEKTS